MRQVTIKPLSKKSLTATPLPGHRKIDLNQRTLATQLIDHRQNAKSTAIEQLIMHEIHAPTLVRSKRAGNHVLPA